eukprot:653649-Prorocentrum_minimum.AAC.1
MAIFYRTRIVHRIVTLFDFRVLRVLGLNPKALLLPPARPPFCLQDPRPLPPGAPPRRSRAPAVGA